MCACFTPSNDKAAPKFHDESNSWEPILALTISIIIQRFLVNKHLLRGKGHENFVGLYINLAPLRRALAISMQNVNFPSSKKNKPQHRKQMQEMKGWTNIFVKR